MTDAVQEQSPESVPVHSPPGDSDEMGQRVRDGWILATLARQEDEEQFPPTIWYAEASGGWIIEHPRGQKRIAKNIVIDGVCKFRLKEVPKVSKFGPTVYKATIELIDGRMFDDSAGS